MITNALETEMVFELENGPQTRDGLLRLFRVSHAEYTDTERSFAIDTIIRNKRVSVVEVSFQDCVPLIWLVDARCKIKVTEGKP